MDTPFFSIIIPVYKVRQDYLEMCVESIRNQSFCNLEVILVDDGSPDNCGAICDEYAKKDARIKVIHQRNQGVSAARNAGIEAAQGEWIMFVDADDWLDKRFIELLMKKMKQVDAELVVCDILYWNSKTSECEISKIRFETDVQDAETEPAVINRVRIFAWGKLWKKSLFTDALF